MNDETKETNSSELLFNRAEQILNYITNLQQENQDLKRMCELYGQSLYNADLTKCESRIDKAIDYIENELFNGKDDLEWCRRNDGTISGSDLPAYCILDLYDILKGDSNE